MRDVLYKQQTQEEYNEEKCKLWNDIYLIPCDMGFMIRSMFELE